MSPLLSCTSIPRLGPRDSLNSIDAALAALSQATRGNVIVRQALETVHRDDVAGRLGYHDDLAVRVAVTPVRLLLGVVARVVDDRLDVIRPDVVLGHLLLGVERIAGDDTG